LEVFFPHLWPSTDRYLQGIMLFCFGMILRRDGLI
jgi:hypothetical protein